MPMHLTLDGRAKVPVPIMDAIENVRETGETLDHDLLESGAHVREHIGELANGFYYYWDPPPPEEWRQARRAWHKFVRTELEKDGIDHDSPSLVCKAYSDHPLQTIWRNVEPIYEPDKHRAIKWMSDYAIKYCIRHVGEEPTIVWVSQVEFGRALSKASGWEYFGGGAARSKALTALSKAKEAGTRTIILSLAAHHAGQNLQKWHRAYYTTVPSSVRLWEQSLGRIHRSGQENAVHVHVFAPVKESKVSFAKALERSKFVYETTGQLQKLLEAKVKRKNK